jgi:hypothetical protein
MRIMGDTVHRTVPMIGIETSWPNDEKENKNLKGSP